MSLKKWMIVGVVCALLLITLYVNLFRQDSRGNLEEDEIDQSRGQKVLMIDDLEDAPANSSANEMKEIASNDRFVLYMDPLNTDIAVLDKTTDVFTHSNPNRAIENLNMDDVQLGIYSPILEIQYTNLSGKMQKYSSYSNSVLLEQFELYEIEDGVRIVYELGLDESKRILPPALRVETYERLMKEFNDDEKADFKPLYRKIKSKSIPKEEKDALLKKYPKLAEEDLYVMRNIKKYDKDILEDILKTHHFTIEDVEAENAYVGYERDETNVVFTVPVDLQIDEEGLVARVDSNYIEEPNDFKITGLNLLRGLGATNEEEGFLLIPDGSGVLFDLVTEEPMTYSKQIYGANQVITAPYKTGFHMPSIMPVFGIKTPKQALFGIVEEGAGITNVVASPKSKMDPLAYVGPEITINEKDYQNYGNLKTNPSGLVLPSDSPEAVVSIRYFFMNEEGVDYSDMAQLYREYLIEKGVLVAKESKQDMIPFYVEMPGAIEKEVSTMGVPVKKKIALTSYEQAMEILKMLSEQGVRGMKMRYTGWTNGGLHNSVFNKVDLMNVLGSKEAFDELLTFAQQNGISIFLDTQFDRVYKDEPFDGFKYSEDASRQLDHKVGVAGTYNPATLKMLDRSKYYIMSPTKMVGVARDYFKDLEEESIQAGISLGTMGRHLNGDYKVGSNITRERSEIYYEEIFKGAEQNTEDILVEQGNAYSWQYASDIVNLPVGGSELYEQFQAIPFVQMVLHGYIDYAAMPLNLSSDLEYETLKAIETGSGVYVQMMYADDKVLVDTVFNDNYSLNYKNRLQDVIEVYKEVANVLNEVVGTEMVKHEQLAKGIYGATYSNGKQVIVNYNDVPWNDSSVVVESRSYTIREVK